MKVSEKIDRATEELRAGDDAAVRVSGWTRYLAAEQVEAGGEMERAVVASDAPQ